MILYIDLKKAVGQVPSTATGPVDERRAVRQHNESFGRQSAGAAGGDPSHDDPQQGGKWSHDEPLDDELEADRKRDTQIAQERGIVSKPEKTQKSEAVDILKSFTGALRAEVDAFKPNDAEVEYLTTQCYKSETVVDQWGRVENVRVPYTRDDVVKGYARIEGSERSRFNAWLHDRLQKSLGKLAR